MAKKIFKHVVVTTFYTSEPIGPDSMPLADIAHNIDEGDSIGISEWRSTDEPIVGKKVINDALLAIGNDGTFFGEEDEED